MRPLLHSALDLTQNKLVREFSTAGDHFGKVDASQLAVRVHDNGVAIAILRPERRFAQLAQIQHDAIPAPVLQQQRHVAHLGLRARQRERGAQCAKYCITVMRVSLT